MQNELRTLLFRVPVAYGRKLKYSVLQSVV